MMKKKIFIFSITALLFMGVMFSANAYQEYISTWEGPAHEHCGHGASTPSVNATLTLSSSVTGDLEPYQAFNVSFALLNFTEALVDPYYGRVMFGIPGVGEEGVVMDNHLFSAPLGIQTLHRRKSVDAWGSYNEDSTIFSYGGGLSNMDCTFTLLAPKAAGTYTLMGLAICGVNQSGDFADTVEHAEVNITYVEGTIQITVVGAVSGVNGETIPGFITLVLLSSIGVTVVAVVLIVRRKRRIIE